MTTPRSPRDRFIQEITPAYNAFFDMRSTNRFGEKQLLRLGIDATISLYHFREHLPDKTQPSRTDLEKQCFDYGLVGDIANASKHGSLTRGRPKLTEINQVDEVVVVTRYQDDEGEYYNPQAEVVATLDDGTRCILACLLHSVYDMWRAKLDQLEFGIFTNPQSPVLDVHVPRDSVKRSPIEILAGEQRQFKYEMRQFDYATRTSKPIDLTGSEFKMTVRELPKSISVRLQSDSLNENMEFDVPLTEEQAVEYMHLEQDSSQAEFLRDVINADEALRERLAHEVQLSSGPLDSDKSD